MTFGKAAKRVHLVFQAVRISNFGSQRIIPNTKAEEESSLRSVPPPLDRCVSLIIRSFIAPRSLAGTSVTNEDYLGQRRPSNWHNGISDIIH